MIALQLPDNRVSVHSSPTGAQSHVMPDQSDKSDRFDYPYVMFSRLTCGYAVILLCGLYLLTSGGLHTAMPYAAPAWACFLTGLILCLSETWQVIFVVFFICFPDVFCLSYAGNVRAEAKDLHHERVIAVFNGMREHFMQMSLAAAESRK